MMEQIEFIAECEKCGIDVNKLTADLIRIGKRKRYIICDICIRKLDKDIKKLVKNFFEKEGG